MKKGDDILAFGSHLGQGSRAEVKKTYIKGNSVRFWGSGVKMSRTQKRASAPGLRKSWCPPSDPQSPVSLALEH